MRTPMLIADDRVDEDREVRTDALTGDRVGGLPVAGVEVHGRRRGKMPPGGKADDADLLRVDLPFSGPLARVKVRSAFWASSSGT